MPDRRFKTKDYPLDQFDEVNFPRPEQTEFDALAEKALSRRGFLAGVATGMTAFVLGSTALTSVVRAAMSSRLAFDAVAANSMDTVTVPKGYSWHVVGAWGDPLWSKGTEFDHATRGTAESQMMAMGDNTDGMAVFAAPDGRMVMAQNNEYTNLEITWGNREGGKFANDDDVKKGMNAHGVSVFEIAQKDGKWSIVKDAAVNRRITPNTEMMLTGPAAGHDLLKTKADPSGTKSLGTWNNCGNGRTPWGTYLTCEENFNGYFSASDKDFVLSAELKRYGVKHDDWGYGWATVDERFDVSKNPNEPNRAGYIVEIDPLDPKSTPKKRTAMGRFKHENAEIVVNDDGHVVAYMGDDERGEFLYKFVSANKMVTVGDNADLLENGTLYVAKFHDGGRGEWLELSPATTGMKSQADICIHTRIAASAVGATTMDRPEWVSFNPKRGEVACCLTNNKNRAVKPNAGGDETPLNGPNPRKGNKYGQIVRWRPDNNDHTSRDFNWDLFVMAGNPTVHSDDRKGSVNVTADNMFNSPDGLAHDTNGLMWILTDGNYSNKDDFAGQGNNQMLVGDPDTGEIKRFLVGPRECEVTGITWTPDRRTLFVGIQHPGEKAKGESHWPGGGDSVPRSAIVAISREDGAQFV
ncbi:PhoX family phosphatase [Magnetospira thiophila]